MIVLDTNIIAYAFINGRYTVQAIDCIQSAKDWIVPPVLQHEITNILVSYGRFKGFSQKECSEILRDIFHFVQSRRIAPVDHDAVMRFSIKNNVSAYDGEFIWLAQANETILITEDSELRKAFPNIAKSLNDYLRND